MLHNILNMIIYAHAMIYNAYICMFFGFSLHLCLGLCPFWIVYCWTGVLPETRMVGKSSRVVAKSLGHQPSHPPGILFVQGTDLYGFPSAYGRI
jgi:hypothetical protein